ncbi:hypothetical protein DPMN_065175 [Dreissena polymorpha]|uniref:Uncharacterized protein n=1 Tax=Dreissena polymorpha TaxID=45954 RepID=A0A9D4CF83_DREPO|nr:hypothetical protein DPMN_065175 [Dreissena polymorpha]
MDFTNDLSFFGFAVTEQEQESFVVSSDTDRNEHNVESGDQADNLLFDCNNNEKATEQPLDLECSVEISHIKKQNAIKLTATLDVQCDGTKKTLYDLQHFHG